MTDPVVAADGHSYERANIATWLESNDSSPITNLKLEHKQLIPNITLKSTILSHLENLKLAESDGRYRPRRRVEHQRNTRSESVASIASLSEYFMADTTANSSGSRRNTNNRNTISQGHDVSATQTPTQAWKNSKYEGDWKERMRHGFGVFMYANGNKYEGEWSHDKRNGRGIFTWASGDRKPCRFRRLLRSFIPNSRI